MSTPLLLLDPPVDESRALPPHEWSALGPLLGALPGDPPRVWTATGRERPVFLDERGVRRRWVALGGTLAATVAALWLGALIAGAIGFSSLPALTPVASGLGARLAAAAPSPGAPRVSFPVHLAAVRLTRGGGLDRDLAAVRGRTGVVSRTHTAPDVDVRLSAAIPRALRPS